VIVTRTRNCPFRLIRYYIIVETAYIKFEAPKGTKVKAGNVFKRPLKVFIKKMTERILPIANPDYEGEIGNVRYWLVECDYVSGIPQREIGLDSKGEAIMKMPYNDNYGYWIDNNLLLDDFKQHFEVSEITREFFEQHWQLINDSLKAG
jgi:hypothetical protein